MERELEHLGHVLPAYAGMIHVYRLETYLAIGAPRVCGDDPLEVSSAALRSMCSPRMRG